MRRSHVLIIYWKILCLFKSNLNRNVWFGSNLFYLCLIQIIIWCVHEENDTIWADSKEEKIKVFVFVSYSSLFKAYLVLLPLQIHTINRHPHYHEKFLFRVRNANKMSFFIQKIVEYKEKFNKDELAKTRSSSNSSMWQWYLVEYSNQSSTIIWDTKFMINTEFLLEICISHARKEIPFHGTIVYRNVSLILSATLKTTG